MNYSVFTPKFKDEALKNLCNSIIPYQCVSFKPSELHSDIEVLHVCLNQFREMGLISDLNFRTAADYCQLTSTASAWDFMNEGGFTFKSEILLQNLTKAKLELEKLESETSSKDHVSQISGITSIIANLITTAQAFVG